MGLFLIRTSMTRSFYVAADYVEEAKEIAVSEEIEEGEYVKEVLEVEDAEPWMMDKAIN